MTPQQAGIIYRLFGDSAIVKDHLDEIIELIRCNNESNDAAIYFLFRKIVEKCDTISLMIEKEFGEVMK